MKLKLILDRLGLLPATLLSGTSAYPHDADNPSPTEGPIGRTLIASVDNGLVAQQAYSSDGRFVTLTVLEPGATSQHVGLVGTVPVYIAEASPDIYQVTWIEEDGAVISNVQNYAAGTEQIFFSYRAADGIRHGEQHTGTIRFAVSTP